MNLKNLSDQTLLENINNLVQREREILSDILHHLREIERRRLFSQLGFRSLFEYATKKLGYADDQAARRISAMRLLAELPELEPKIASGSLTLTNLGMAQTLFRMEMRKSVNSDKTFSVSKKLEILAQLEHKSKREAEKILTAHASEPTLLKSDRIRTLSVSTIEIKFSAPEQLQAQLEKVKGLLAHKHSNLSMAELIQRLCEIAIKELDPREKASRQKKSRKRTMSPAPALKLRVEKLKVKRNPIPAAIVKQVWQKADSQCQNCRSVHALQVDHIDPLALGGSNDIENLRLLCRSCNQRAAINKIGLSKMDRYL